MAGFNAFEIGPAQLLSGIGKTVFLFGLVCRVVCRSSLHLKNDIAGVKERETIVVVLWGLQTARCGPGVLRGVQILREMFYAEMR
jgi:hypothetical protein